MGNSGTASVHKPVDEKSTKTTIPFFKNNNLDYADFVGFLGEHAQDAGWIVFVFITIFVVTAVSNGANLNDGMDGMAAGNSAIIGVTLGILAYVSSHAERAVHIDTAAVAIGVTILNRAAVHDEQAALIYQHAAALCSTATSTRSTSL